MSRQSEDITEEEQFLRAIESNNGIITKICYYYAKDAEDFNDLRQDVLTNMWAYRESFRGDSSLTTWIYRLTLNTCISAFRKKKRKGEKVSLETLTGLSADTTDISEMHREMHRLISRLSASEKAIVLLWLDDRPYEEIAIIIGCPRNTIATRLRRIKEKIVKMSNE